MLEFKYDMNSHLRGQGVFPPPSPPLLWQSTSGQEPSVSLPSPLSFPRDAFYQKKKKHHVMKCKEAAVAAIIQMFNEFLPTGFQANQWAAREEDSAGPNQYCYDCNSMVYGI